jgi:gas vesicle protein
MIYGHQRDYGWSRSGLLVGMMVGAALGAGLGLLFAPQLGTETRRSLARAGRRMRDSLETGRERLVRAIRERPGAPGFPFPD